MSTPERKQDITKEDLPYQVMGKYFWATSDQEALIKRRDIVKNNQIWLAKMAWVAVYDGKVNNGKQNIIIADKLRNNDVKPFYDYETNAKKIDDFDEVKIIVKNKNLLQQRDMEFYIANLSDKQIAQLNMLSPLQKAFFISEECAKVDITQRQIKRKIETGGDIENKNLAVMKELENRISNMNLFLKKYNLIEYLLDEKTKIFVDKEMEQGYQEYISKGIGADAYKKMKAEKKNTDDIDLAVRWAYMQQKMYASEKYAALTPDAKEELANMTVEYYTITQKLQIDLDEFGLGNIYVKAREYLTEWYGNNEKEPCHTLINNINADSDMKTFFEKEENKITKLSQTETDQDKKRDKIFYKRLFILYPDANVAISGKDLDEYYNDDMSIKDSISEAEKKDAEWIFAKIQEVSKPYEDKLLTKTTSVVQEYTINQCMESLQSYMDIDISKQNLSEQLTILNDDNAVSDENWELLFKIQWERDGKKLTLSYDLISGQVYHHPFLYKDSLNDTDPLTLGEKNDRNKLPLTNLPSMSQIIMWAQNDDYTTLMNTSDTLTDYEKNIQENMDVSLVFDKNISYELGQDKLKKQIIQDEIVQNLVKFSWRTLSASESITTQYQNVYGLYNYIYKSLEYYSMGSIDQLNKFSKNITTLLEYRNENISKSTDEVLKYKEDKENPTTYQNDEMFFIQSLVNQAVIPQITSKLTEQWPEENMMSLFKCFEKTISGISIIDVDKMDDYFSAATGTNKTENKVGKWERNTEFTTLVNNMQDKLGKHWIDDKYTTQLNDIYENLPE